jgi:galactokinase
MRSPGRESSAAFAPGRANLIGEHTDYNEGLALPFAIAEGVVVRALALPTPAGAPELIMAHARDLGESDEFELDRPRPVAGWRAFVRGVVAELSAGGHELRAAELDISGDVPVGAGLSSSAALEVSLCLALLELAAPADGTALEAPDRVTLARICQRVEGEWVGVRSGLLDQLASLFGEADRALLIDFRDLAIEPVPLRLGDWRLLVLDSGERHSLADSGYNRRRSECARACELLGVASLRDASVDTTRELPEPLSRRALHVISENQRVREAATALRAGDLATVAELLNASHASLRDCYEVSTPAVEAAVQAMRDAGAAGARIVGGGFGGSVLGLMPPDRPSAGRSVLPRARELRPSPGARVLVAGREPTH